MSSEPLTRRALHDRRAGVWDYVSPSRLSLWLKCPLAFKLKYIDGAAVPTSAAMFIGRQVHAGLELYYGHRQVGLELQATEIVRRIDAVWPAAVEADEVAFTSTEQERAARRQTADLLYAYLAVKRADEPRPLAVETVAEAPLVDPLSGENLGLPLVGVIDLVLDGEHGQVGPQIVDFKTSSRSGPPMEIAHEVQLGCYAWLLRHTTSRTEGGLEIRSLIKTKTPKIECHAYSPRSDAHFRRLLAVVRAYLDDLDAGRFVYRPSWSCSSCPHRDGPCRSWQG